MRTPGADHLERVRPGDPACLSTRKVRRADRHLAHEALDQEEMAAGAYADQVAWVRRMAA